ncbi:MAG: hypothetical protein A2V98_04870 [Planctomycetes bacterium RBG_16_64_12]|nr:MAG: hypothetical protein A2V98_04870 [Planctomycetes bacterium RBG_16_64_12]
METLKKKGTETPPAVLLCSLPQGSPNMAGKNKPKRTEPKEPEPIAAAVDAAPTEPSPSQALAKPADGQAGLDDVAADVVATIDANVQATGKTGRKSRAWHKEPADNFEQDDEGRIKLRNGRPIRRSGRPHKAKAGDRLAGGGIMADDSIEVFDATKAGAGAEAQPAGSAGADAQPRPTDAQPIGEPAGKVVADGVFNVVEAIAGEDAKPTAGERDAIGGAAGRTLAGLTLPAWLSLIVFGALYVFRVVVVKRSKRKAEKPPENPAHDDARLHSRNDADGQNPPGQGPRFRYN